MQLVWLRNDLRLEDNPALYRASECGSVCCVYIVTEQQWREHGDAPAKIALWRARLSALAEELLHKNIPLKLRVLDNYGQIPQALLALAQSLAASALWFNREYPLNEAVRDAQVADLCVQQGLDCHCLHGDVILAPGTVTTQAGGVYHVFTPFARQWRKQLTAADYTALPAPQAQSVTAVVSDTIEALWPLLDRDYRQDVWPADTAAIHRCLQQFLQKKVQHYSEGRDFPGLSGTSTLSPYLACGALSARQCLQALLHSTERGLENQWATELIWREFYRHLVAAYPHLSRSENFKTGMQAIPWANDAKQWQAWCSGQTGFPIVDAAIKQLVQTGWMHNRLRMVTAAFLTKILLIDWRWGEAFFMAHLLDGDYASNNGGWQWAASTGADSVPYFRIFNPERQSLRFDPEGVFIRRLLPALSVLDNKSIHNPSEQQRQQCGYPQAIIDYKFARQRALDVYANV
ncbi:MAG: deoxyribodipyrimidine photo-lyase [Cellvibrionaceae bacterium]|nr:deoxyribodipyrimidine photo-lyase [Cellvibrionaceae bacterium]